MSAEKKVLLLFISLIMLIVACVYTHLPNFMKEETKSSTSVVEVQKIQEESKIVESANTIVENETIEENLNNTNNENESENLEQEVSNTVGNEKSELPEEVVEVKIEDQVPEIPLITTDKRYIRTETEKNIEELSRKTQELQIKISDYVKENPVSFTRGSYNPTKKSEKTIEMVFETLKEFENLRIEVAGHTDAVGAAKLNQTISLKRAEAVKDKLVLLGVSEDRIIARGYGEDIPFVKNSAKGYSKINRRVEFNIVEE